MNPKLVSEYYADCLACGAPEAQAPELLSPLTKNDADTYFIRQPSSADEIEKACKATESRCTYALRYGGMNLAIIERLSNDPKYCDYLISEEGTIHL